VQLRMLVTIAVVAAAVAAPVHAAAPAPGGGAAPPGSAEPAGTAQSGGSVWAAFGLGAGATLLFVAALYGSVRLMRLTHDAYRSLRVDG